MKTNFCKVLRKNFGYIPSHLNGIESIYTSEHSIFITYIGKSVLLCLSSDT
jgi:hypothetical protein